MGIFRLTSFRNKFMLTNHKCNLIILFSVSLITFFLLSSNSVHATIVQNEVDKFEKLILSLKGVMMFSIDIWLLPYGVNACRKTWIYFQ